jgi:hypothetical protein
MRRDQLGESLRNKLLDVYGSCTALKVSLAYYMTQMFAWIEKNGWAGWDPYDVWETELGLWMLSERRGIVKRGASFFISVIEKLAPLLVRRILRVEPKINAKAMGLFAYSFLELEVVEGESRRIGGEPAYLSCFRWLERNRVDHYGGWGWGYPFDWQSRELIPRNTPTVVNSAIIGDAYWLLYCCHNDLKALQVCESICEFITKGLNRSPRAEDSSFCFSYTPVDHFQVHNANLFGAEFLVRIGTEVGRDEWVNIGLAAGRFSLKEIRSDGTLNYWSNEQDLDGLQQDAYHSGFEIRALDGIARATGDKEFRKAADRYFETWLRDFFSEDGVPSFIRGRHDIIEVHSCAESLLCAVEMHESGRLSKASLVEHVKRVLDATVNALWTQDGPEKGYFAWMRHKRYGFNTKVDIPLMRWGEAWMFRALSAMLVALRCDTMDCAI